MPRKEKPCAVCGSLCAGHAQICRPCYRKEQAEKRAHLANPNPSGLCLCGCGRKTTIASSTQRGAVRGFPAKFIKGHVKSIPFEDRYDIDPETNCWNFRTRFTQTGYGKIGNVGAHTISYRMFKGEIPEGLVIDHLCRNHACANPDHLEAVTNAINCRRGSGTKLSDADVAEIRLIGRSKAQQEIAEMFGVTQKTISYVLSGRSHV